jgi:hypothetical protein
MQYEAHVLRYALAANKCCICCLLFAAFAAVAIRLLLLQWLHELPAALLCSCPPASPLIQGERSGMPAPI